MDPELAKQGLGYALFVGSLGVVFYQNRKIEALNTKLNELQEKRLADLVQLTTQFLNTAKDMLNGNANILKSIDKITEILENFRKK